MSALLQGKPRVAFAVHVTRLDANPAPDLITPTLSIAKVGEARGRGRNRGLDMWTLSISEC